MPKSNILSEIVQLGEEDIAGRIAAEKQRYAKLRHMHAVTPIESPIQIRNLRRDIARIQHALDKCRKQATKDKK